jgi:hypothetical protein
VIIKQRHILFILLIGILSFTVRGVYGSEGEALKYIDYCKTAISFTDLSNLSKTEALTIGFCLGLMDGLRGVNYFLKKADPSSAFCEPTTYGNLDLAKSFVTFANTHPELKELRGALAAQVALRTAFPCNEGK